MFALASQGLASRSASCIQTFRSRVTLQAFATNTSCLFSSSSSSSKERPLSFRPRRQTPKNLLEVPKAKSHSKKTKSPIKLTKNTPNETLESKYGNDAATAIRHFRRAKEEKGAIQNETLFSSAEDTMRAADYLTADIGSTEDLVGERRALMDAWDSDHADNFKRELHKIMEEQTEFAFKDLPWNEDLKKDDGIKSDSFAKSNAREDGEDPNQKAFGPWSETIVRVDRVQKVQRGGTMVRYRALVVGGKSYSCPFLGDEHSFWHFIGTKRCFHLCMCLHKKEI